MAGPTDFFTAEEVERARRYHRPRHLALLLDLLVSLALLAWLSFGWPGDRLDGGLASLPWPLRSAALVAAAAGLLSLGGLPTEFLLRHRRERRYGLSTQSDAAWLRDQAASLGVGLLLAAVPVVALAALARAFPAAWPLVGAPALALLVIALSFVAPVALEPLFNRFEPLPDEALAEDLQRLARAAGVPVRDVLVADASRRTTRQNAYVSGLGRTRRVVVFDTLLRGADRRGLRLVVAHELGHRRARHVLQGTLLAAAGAAAAVLALWGLLRWPALLRAVGASGAGDPRVAPFVLLAFSLLELLALPFLSALSRRWERAADRFSLELTGDCEAFADAHRSLALSNLAELDPPRLLHALLASHPTPPERLASLDEGAG